MPMQDRAVNLIASLEGEGIGRRPLIFVCHSLGGLLAKQIAFQCLSLVSRKSSMGGNIRGICFLATPHSGSSLSKVADAFRLVYRPTAAVKDLEENDAYLRMLNRWYREEAPAHGIETLTLFETVRMKGVLVVDASSSDPGIAGVDPIPTDCDHITICKPPSRSDLVYRQVHHFVDVLLNAPPAGRVATTSTVSGQNPRIPIPPKESTRVLTRLVNQLESSGVLDEGRNWLLRDQIPDSGGWGLSQATLFNRLNGRSVSDVERREGGIISTYVALRSLRACEESDEIFRSRPYAWRAAQYLLERQTTEGGFGRYVESRSGEEIHPSVRHTAFAVSALLDLDPGSEAMRDGVAYLKRRLAGPGDGWWADEASPSLALASLLHVDDRLSAADDDEDPEWNKIDAILSDESRREIRSNLAKLSSSGSHSPFWLPYAKMEAMVYDTALTTVDLLPRPIRKSLRLPVARVLSEILNKAIDGGIPYEPRQRFADIGSTALMLFTIASLLARDEKMASILTEWNLAQAIPSLVQFILENWEVEDAWRFTYSDTLAYLLLIPELAT